MSRQQGVFAALALAALALSACGDSSSTATPTAGETSVALPPSSAQSSRDLQSTSEASGTGGAPQQPTTSPATPRASTASASGGAAAFENKGGDNSIQRYGHESSPSQLAQAGAALHAYLDARAAGNWATACRGMASGLAASLQQLSGEAAKRARGKRPACPRLLAEISAGMPAGLDRELKQVRLGALRVQGERAFLLYRGAHRTAYFIPMAEQGGHWKVAAIAASALP